MVICFVYSVCMSLNRVVSLRKSVCSKITLQSWISGKIQQSEILASTLVSLHRMWGIFERLVEKNNCLEIIS